MQKIEKQASCLALGKVLDIETLPDSVFLTRKQVAQLSGFTEQAFKKWARNGRGPAITRLEGYPRYRAADVRAWLRGDSADA